jgi:hypothetical protein
MHRLSASGKRLVILSFVMGTVLSTAYCQDADSLKTADKCKSSAKCLPVNE